MSITQLIWFREDRPAWEDPNELINALMDDCVFDDFLRDCNYSFTDQQRQTAHKFMAELKLFLDTAPDVLDSAETFNHPQWLVIQNAATDFVIAFTKS